MKKFNQYVIFAVLISTFALHAAPAWAAVGLGAGTPEFVIFTDPPTIVGFGGKLWSVIGNNGEGIATVPGMLTLLANESYGDSRFHNVASNVYSGSELKDKMDDAFFALAAGERGLVAPRELTGGSGNKGEMNYNGFDIAGPTIVSTHFWPLGENEVISLNNGVKKFGVAMNWWLRSPGYNNDEAAYVFSDSGFMEFDAKVSFTLVVRPAFRLILEHVIFTSAISVANGKDSVAVGNVLSATSAPAVLVKFTVGGGANVSLTCTDTAARNVTEGDTVSIAYSGAQTAANKYVSCVITDSSGTVRFYGKLATAASGTASFIVPEAADLPPGNYTIRLFNEECVSGNFTDYASLPVNIPLRITSGGGGGGGGGCDAGFGVFGCFGIFAIAVLFARRRNHPALRAPLHGGE